MKLFKGLKKILNYSMRNKLIHNQLLYRQYLLLKNPEFKFPVFLFIKLNSKLK